MGRQEAKLQVLKPFGPRVLKVELPDSITNKLISITDEMFQDENKKSYGENLVGQIKCEIEIDKKVLQENKVYDFFKQCLHAYVDSCLKDIYTFNENTHSINCEVTDMWFNEMKPGEYNPAHFHTNCLVSSTLFLKIPKNNPERKIKHKTNKDGCLEFIDRSVATDYLQKGQMLIKPEVGVMYLWPSSLYHTVYPFLGDEVRRSIAWNGTYQFIKKETDTVIAGLRPWSIK